MSIRPSTFSIVACDLEAGELGVATQSKFLAVGSVVPWARGGVGAVATQSWANTSYGPGGLDLLSRDMEPQAVLEALVADDPQRESRQVGIVDARGRAATFTGAECFAWAGGRTGAGYACQGNILVGNDTVDAMARSFEASAGSELAARLVDALAAGQTAGGDSRGQQSAALLVVKPDGGYGGFNDRFLDLRVDDHSTPIEELGRLLRLHQLYYPRRDELTVAMEGDVLAQLASDLQKLGYLRDTSPSPEASAVHAALVKYGMTENLEERMRDDGRIYRIVLDFVHEQATG